MTNPTQQLADAHEEGVRDYRRFGNDAVCPYPQGTNPTELGAIGSLRAEWFKGFYETQLNKKYGHIFWKHNLPLMDGKTMPDGGIDLGASNRKLTT
jgi:hypothetical protein